MPTEIRVPTLGESVVEATVGQWFKEAGDAVSADEPLVELETDKVTVEVPAPASGVLSEIVVKSGDTVEVGALLGAIDGDGKAKPAEKPSKTNGKTAAIAEAKPKSAPEEAETPPEETETAPQPVAGELKALQREPQIREEVRPGVMPPSPSARKLMAERGLKPGDVKGSGRRGQILKGDVIAEAAETIRVHERAPKPPAQPRAPVAPTDEAREERVRMTRLRQTIAKRLKEAQDTAAMLTTFNDVDMSAILKLRKDYREDFEEKHGVKLGFMGFFVKACVQALKDIPAVNAEIDGEDIVYKNYYHIGVAVGTERGLVVPVVRDADQKSLAEIEAAIADFGVRARDGKLGLQEMQGGTFTISNGGIYGSMLSTHLERAAIRHPRHAPHRGARGRSRRADRGAADDVSGALLRSPPGGRQGGGHLPGERQGVAGEPRPARPRPLKH